MKTFTHALALWSALAFAVPNVSSADARDWNEGEEILQQHLQPGRTPAEYQQMLRDLGYVITSVNYNTPDYVEYEVVKDQRTYEVQIDVDENTGEAANIDIASNVWKTGGTRAALRTAESMASLSDPNYILVLTPIYTVDAQERSAMENMVRELEQLPVGQNPQAYQDALQERGYKIMDTAARKNKTQLRVAKDGKEALVNIRFDQDTGKSVQVNAFPLLLNVAGDRPTQAAQPQQGEDEEEDEG